MSTVLETWIDGSVGETRYALARAGRPIALKVLRAADDGRRARWGETFIGRVAKADPALRGAFVELGLSAEQGFLPQSRKDPAPKEGEPILALVTREAARGKSPVLERLAERPPDGKPQRFARHRSDETLDAARPASPDIRAALDEAFEAALSPEAGLPGGGRLIIEPTAALVAIDVDSAGRPGSKDAEAFAKALNLAAAAEALHQLRLRNLGGLAAIDFVSLKSAAARADVIAAVKTAAQSDPWGVQVGGLSRFGVLELARGQLVQPHHEALLERPGGPLNAESAALCALRAIQSAAATARGRRVVCEVAPSAAAWLKASFPAYAALLTAEIGPMWALEAQPNLRAPFAVRLV